MITAQVKIHAAIEFQRIFAVGQNLPALRNKAPFKGFGGKNMEDYAPFSSVIPFG